MSVVSYLDRFLDPMTEAFTPEVARAIIDLRTDPELKSHIDELRHKANEGTLTSEEDSEYKELVEALDIISIIQSKARRFLAEYPT